MKKLSIILALSLGLATLPAFAEESDEDMPELESTDEVSTKKNAPAAAAKETHQASKNPLEVTNIPFPANGLHFFGHRIVDNEKGVVCYTVVKAGTAPQLWCSK